MTDLIYGHVTLIEIQLCERIRFGAIICPNQIPTPEK